MTDLEIFNCALVRVGCEPLTSLTGTSTAHRLYDNVYAATVKKLLYSHPWNFALKRETITENGNTPTYEFTYEFDHPADLLRILEIEDQNCIEHKVENTKILANEETLNIRYIADITDASLFSVGFAELLELKLAEKLAYKYTQSNSLRESFAKEFREMSDNIRSYDAQSGGTPRDFQDEVFLNSRK